MGWAIIGMVFIAWLTLVLLFTPRIDYHVTIPLRPDSDEFLYVHAVRPVRPAQSIATIGSRFSPTARSSIRRCATRFCAAEQSINIEAYIFQPGDAADMLVDAMIARAKAGVEVRAGPRRHRQLLLMNSAAGG